MDKVTVTEEQLMSAIKECLDEMSADVQQNDSFLPFGKELVIRVLPFAYVGFKEFGLWKKLTQG